MSAVPTYEVVLATPTGDAVLEVPSFLGAEAAGRRALWTAVAQGWGDVDQVAVISSVRLHEQRDAGSATTAGVLLFLIFGGLLFLAALHLGQQAMCDLNDQGLRYCAGYSPTTTETEHP